MVVDMLAEKNAEIGKAVAIIKRLSGDARERRIAEMQEMARRDEASRMNGALRKEREKWERILADKDAAIAGKDAAIADKDAAIADKDAAIADNAASLADKDAAIADKDTENAQLRAQLAELRARLGEDR
jgi:chromosome segregation ATPase